MIREATPSSLYGTNVPAPWSNKKSILSESEDSLRQESPTLLSLYSSYSSPRRGYSTTPRYLDDTDDSTRVSPLVVDTAFRETPSPTKSAKKRKKALHTLTDISTDEYIPSYMRGTKSSANKTQLDIKLNENKHSSRTALSVVGNEREQANSGRSTPKLTTPRD